MAMSRSRSKRDPRHAHRHGRRLAALARELAELGRQATQGHGEVIAITLPVISLIIALGIFSPSLRLPIVSTGVVISLVYWVLGQSLGGPFRRRAGNDVSAAPLFILLGIALIPGARRPTGPDRA